MFPTQQLLDILRKDVPTFCENMYGNIRWHMKTRHIAVFKQFEVKEYISTLFWHRL